MLLPAAETARVFVTANGYYRVNPKLDLYHFALIDLFSGYGAQIGRVIGPMPATPLLPKYLPGLSTLLADRQIWPVLLTLGVLVMIVPGIVVGLTLTTSGKLTEAFTAMV